MELYGTILYVYGTIYGTIWNYNKGIEVINF